MMRKTLYFLLPWLFLSMLGGIEKVTADPLVNTTVTNQSIVMSNIEFQALKKSEQETIASGWGITTDDYIKYLDLMNNTSSGHWYTTLDPVEVLGINATNNEARHRYALIAAHGAFARVEKELAFQRAYDEAFKSLYGNIKPIALGGAS
jgi:hypothetical protein